MVSEVWNKTDSSKAHTCYWGEGQFWLIHGKLKSIKSDMSKQKKKKKSLPCIRGYLWEGAERGEVSQNQMEQNSFWDMTLLQKKVSEKKNVLEKED